jgi:hypothetical protein
MAVPVLFGTPYRATRAHLGPDVSEEVRLTTATRARSASNALERRIHVKGAEMILFPIVLAVLVLSGWYAYERKRTGAPPFSPWVLWVALTAIGVFLAFWWWALLVIAAVLVIAAWGVGSLLARRREGDARSAI